MTEKNRKHICPICKKEIQWEGNESRPFCSGRCRLIDLGKWASDEYRIIGEKKDLPERDKKEKNNSQG